MSAIPKGLGLNTVAGTLRDGDLQRQLNELEKDADTFVGASGKAVPTALIVGTARAQPTPGGNGYDDYVFGDAVGEEMRKHRLRIKTGGGGGAMEAPAVGYTRTDAALRRSGKAGTFAAEVHGANIILPHEQSANRYITPGRLSSYEHFLFRMERLFSGITDFAALPGGFGTVAEVYTFLAMKSHKQVGDPIAFGAPDDYYEKLNAAFAPLVNQSEREELTHLFRDPAAMVKYLKKEADTVKDPAAKRVAPRMLADLKAGFQKIDSQASAYAFFGGGGARTAAAAPVMGEIAAALAQKGEVLRVSGSPIVDTVVRDAARSQNTTATVQAFALDDAPVSNSDGIEYTKIKDVLVLRELMNANVKGLIVSPEGAKQIGLLFTAVCDMQTGEMPKLPIIVVDPDGQFAALKETLRTQLLSDKRRYINPEDLDLFTVVNDSATAMRVLNSAAAQVTSRPAASERPAATQAVNALLNVDLSEDVRNWVKAELAPQATIMDAMLIMENARKRVPREGQPSVARTDFPNTEEEAIQMLLNRLGLSALEKQTVNAALALVDAGAQLPSGHFESIGGSSKTNPETHRTQMAVTDPGLDHLFLTLADPTMFDGAFVHVEIIDRDTDNMVPYSNPGPRTIRRIRLLLGKDAPITVFFGSPNNVASYVQDQVPGLDEASAGLRFNTPTAVNQLANAARGLFDSGISEVKVTMDGYSREEVISAGQQINGQAMPGEGRYISAAFNLNAAVRDFGLVPPDAPPIVGAPTEAQRELMLRAAFAAIDAAVAGGWKKVTLDSAAKGAPSRPLIEWFGVENLLRANRYGHTNGRELYGSAGMRDYHFPILQLSGEDAVGVGTFIHEAPSADAPGKVGRMIPERVRSSLGYRNAAESAPVGRLATLSRVLDEKFLVGELNSEALIQLREDAFTALREVARDIDPQLNLLVAARDAAVTQAASLPSAQKQEASDAAKATFESEFKALITRALQAPAAIEKAETLLARAARAGVKV